LALRTAALGNQWAGVQQLRALPELQGNERIALACDRTLRRRLSEQGKIKIISAFIVLFFL
jgi:hypothetical protein